MATTSSTPLEPTSWPGSEDYEKLLLQMVRRSMRSHDANEQLALSTELQNGKIQLVVTALDREDEHPAEAGIGEDGLHDDDAADQDADIDR